MARSVEPNMPVSLMFSRMSRGGWRLLRELLGGALILAVWMALWTWTVALILQPWRPPDAPARPAAVERA